jgi:hypothetical protein
MLAGQTGYPYSIEGAAFYHADVLTPAVRDLTP